MKTSESLSKALGIEHEVEILPPLKQEVAVIEEPAAVGSVDQQEDYTLARSTFRQLINRGNDAIEGISDLAKESESPRAYEVMATLMRTVADTTKDLYDLQKKTKDLLTNNGSKKLDETNITVDKAVFVGTTAELLRKVKNNEDI
jgi:hypothetical protein